MIDNLDASGSSLRLLLGQLLKTLSTEVLLRYLVDEDYIVRTAVARELHMRTGEHIHRKVLELVDDENENAREIAAFVLGQFGTPTMPYKEESVPALFKLLKDDSHEVRAAASAALGHLCYDGMPTDVESALLEAAGDASADVRACVAYALGNSSGSERVQSVLDELLSDHDEEVREFAVLGKELLDC